MFGPRWIRAYVHSGNFVEVHALVPEVHGQPHSLLIERLPLGAVDSPTIRHCHWPA